jgi:antitoxin component YwqK of YwqJK toxin-antitoxin module
MKKIFCLISVLLLFCYCNKNKKVIEETYDDGSPKIEKYYKGEGADKELVKEIRYYSNHQKEMQGEYKDAKRDGNWVYYYKNGKKWSEGAFVEGLDEGKRTVYYETGKIRYEGFYNKGKQSGIWKFFDENSKLIKEIDYDKDTTISK